MIRVGPKLKSLYPSPVARASLCSHNFLGWGNRDKGQPGPYLVRSLLPLGKGNAWLTDEVTTTQTGLGCPVASHFRGTSRECMILTTPQPPRPP